jgi:Zn-dependent protease with chaperone function
MTNETTVAQARSGHSPGDATDVSAEAANGQDSGNLLTEEQIKKALSSKIEPVRTTAHYRLWIALVAAIMVLLPLIYASIIALLVAGLVYHARHNVAVFESLGRGNNSLKVALAVYVSPLVVGGVVVLFMLKPIFARPAKREKLRVLDRESEPLLHTLVEGICAAVGSPRPARIEVNCDLNASAHREGPLLGLFGSRLILTIGIPLAAGLSLKQFTGVLAHEFGHFSQGAGMRLCALIRTVNMWFARVVYERDAWDQRLETMASYNHLYIQILGGLTRLAVWLTRRVLWALMWVGHLVSSFLSRQMEFDADRYEARMVGGHVFAETMWRLRVLSVAQNGAFSDLGSSWNERRLPDDFSKLVLANVPQIPEPLMETMRADVNKTETGWFESHPCDKDRTARALADVPGAGMFRIDGPSNAVFSNLDALSKTASLDYYRSMVGAPINGEQLFSVAQLVQTQVQHHEAQAASTRFFLGSTSLSRLTLDLPERFPQLPPGIEAAKQAIIDARNELLAARSAHLEATKQREEVERRLLRLEYAITALGAGLKINLIECDMRTPNLADAITLRDRLRQDMCRLDEASAPFAAAVRRLPLDLAILDDDNLADRLPDALERRREAHALYTCVANLGRHYQQATERLTVTRTVLLDLAAAINNTKNAQKQACSAAFEIAGANLAGAIEYLRSTLDDSIAYPFEHAEQNISLRKFILGDGLPEKTDLQGLIQTSYEACSRLDGLYFRALGRLAVTAEAVEESLGLFPIPLDEPEDAPAKRAEDGGRRTEN